MEDVNKSILPQELDSRNSNRIPEFIIGKDLLYHGTGISGITRFLPSEETTIGQGVYLTFDIIAAEEYARRRAKKRQNARPVIYQVEVENLKLADLREIEDIEIFAQVLLRKLKEDLITGVDLGWVIEGAIRSTVDKIRNNKFKHLKDITLNHQDTTTSVLQERGFDGIIGLEGGEGKEPRNHDSVVIFDPSKVKVIKEEVV